MTGEIHLIDADLASLTSTLKEADRALDTLNIHSAFDYAARALPGSQSAGACRSFADELREQCHTLATRLGNFAEDVEDTRRAAQEVDREIGRGFDQTTNHFTPGCQDGGIRVPIHHQAGGR